MRKQGIDGTGMLNLYDRVTGIFNEIFDARLLTAAIFALVGYCTLFMQQKFPMRWMIFVLFGMILLAFVTLTARMPGKAKVRFHKGMAGLWFALHGMMVVSGLFYQDWLPESVPLLICYPIVFPCSPRERMNRHSALFCAARCLLSCRFWRGRI